MPRTTTARPLFDRVAIVGVGLLGASLGLALKKAGLAGTIVGIGRKGSPSLAIAKKRRAIDLAATDPAKGVKNADLVVLCTPVRQFPGMLRAIRRGLKAGAMVTDVGSTKQQVMRWAHELLPTSVPFVGSHPMAGSEKRGPEAARADLYQNAVCLLCAENAHTPAAKEALHRINQLWRALGMKTICLSAAEHDRWVATASHLPHAMATCLVAAAAENPAALQAIAGGFIDSTRIASSDPDMWTDIFLTNAEPVAAAIGRLQRHLASFKKAVAAGDEAAIRAHLSAAKTTRDALLAARARGA